MSHLALVEELKYTLKEIQAVNDRLGEMNNEAIVLQNKLHALQALRQRIEVDLTTITLEVL